MSAKPPKAERRGEWLIWPLLVIEGLLFSWHALICVLVLISRLAGHLAELVPCLPLLSW